MKSRELKALTLVEQKNQISEAYKELMKLRAQARTTSPQNPGRIGSLKRTIAQILTVQHMKPMPKPVTKQKPVEAKKKQ